MKLYIYPQNLKATANLWLWGLRDFAILCVGLLVSFVALTQLGLLLPLALTAAWAFLTIRMEDLTVLDFIRFAAKFTFQGSAQQYSCQSADLGGLGLLCAEGVFRQHQAGRHSAHPDGSWFALFVQRPPWLHRWIFSVVQADLRSVPDGFPPDGTAVFRAAHISGQYAPGSGRYAGSRGGAEDRSAVWPGQLCKS